MSSFTSLKWKMNFSGENRGVEKPANVTGSWKNVIFSGICLELIPMPTKRDDRNLEELNIMIHYKYITRSLAEKLQRKS